MNRAFRLGLPLLALVVYWTQTMIDRQMPENREAKEVLYLTSGTVLRKMSLGHEGLLADIYWMRAVQYYGGKRLTGNSHFPLLKPYLDLTTTLDPRLFYAYRFGSIFLSEPPPVGANQPEAALELIRQGIASNPDAWQLYKDLGFVYYWYLKDYPKAYEVFLEGSKHPGAAKWMRTFAAELAAKGGNRNTARFLWQQMYESAEEEQLKRNARENLIRLTADDEMEELQHLVEIVQTRLGRPIHSLEELVQMGLLKGIPADPKGFTYHLDANTGRVGLSPESTVRRYSP